MSEARKASKPASAVLVNGQDVVVLSASGSVVGVLESPKRGNRGGRPPGSGSKFREDWAEEIVQWVSAGKSVSDWLQPRGIGWSTFSGWLKDHPSFAEGYAQARVASADRLADEIVAIADDESLDPKSRTIRVDARKWVASKLKPRAYGDKLDLSVTEVVRIPDVELDAQLARFMAKALPKPST